MSNKSLEDYHFHSAIHFNRIEVEKMPDYVQHQALVNLRTRLMDFALNKIRTVRRVEGDENFCVEHRVDVYVIPPELLFKVINEEAQRLARYYMGP